MSEWIIAENTKNLLIQFAFFYYPLHDLPLLWTSERITVTQVLMAVVTHFSSKDTPEGRMRIELAPAVKLDITGLHWGSWIIVEGWGGHEGNFPAGPITDFASMSGYLHCTESRNIPPSALLKLEDLVPAQISVGLHGNIQDEGVVGIQRIGIVMRYNVHETTYVM